MARPVLQADDAPALAPEPFVPAAGFRSGFVAVLGLPNVGKSTLINGFFDRSPCIVSARPQTTRFHVRCISTTATRQIVFVDTPGWHAQGKTLGRFMRREITRSLDGADVLLLLLDAERPDVARTRYALGVLLEGARPAVVAVVNKIDRIGKGALAKLLQELFVAFTPREIVPVSALKKSNLQELDAVLTACLPEGPPLYPPEIRIDKPRQFLVSEFIREQLFAVTHQEVPFSCAVDVETVNDEGPALRVEAAILVERDSQKGIVIGADGRTIARIRQLATERIRRYEHRRVQLELAVRVSPSWASDEGLLERLGEGR